MDPELTLKKANMLVRQHEAVQEQQSLLQHGPKVDKVIDSLHKAVRRQILRPLEIRLCSVL